MYKPPKLVTQKTLREIAPPNISPAGPCIWKIALKYRVKQSKNGKSPSNYKLAQSILKRKLPPVHKPLLLNTLYFKTASLEINSISIL